jgi:hypothetical protein
VHRLHFALLVAIGVALLACAGETKKPAGPVLSLDMKLEQPDEIRSILGASLLLDGREVARFAQPRPEVVVVFSKIVEGVQPGPHVVEVRVDAQVDSPTPYSGGGYATYGGKAHPLMGTGGILANGQSLRFEVTF